jgi:hypothetical protein
MYIQTAKIGAHEKKMIFATGNWHFPVSRKSGVCGSLQKSFFDEI